MAALREGSRSREDSGWSWARSERGEEQQGAGDGDEQDSYGAQIGTALIAVLRAGNQQGTCAKAATRRVIRMSAELQRAHKTCALDQEASRTRPRRQFEFVHIRVKSVCAVASCSRMAWPVLPAGVSRDQEERDTIRGVVRGGL